MSDASEKLRRYIAGQPATAGSVLNANIALPVCDEVERQEILIEALKECYEHLDRRHMIASSVPGMIDPDDEKTSIVRVKSLLEGWE